MPHPQPQSPAAPLTHQLQQQLTELEARSLRRSLHALTPQGRLVETGGRKLVNLASNDYLALSQHPRLKQAAADAIERFGVGAGASRLVAGHHPLHEKLEQRFAAFKHAEAALLFPTGYTANFAVLTTLAGRGDAVLIDKLTHASLIDAARASGAEVRSFRHLDYDHLAERLAKARDKTSGRVFVVTDSVFSMDGDEADLAALCELARRFDAITVVDEAHATGLFGPNGQGLTAGHPVDIVVSTAGKALGALGGIVTSSRAVIDTLVNAARSFIYTTAPPPAQAAAIDAALDVVRDEPQRRQRVLGLAEQLRGALRDAGWPLPHGRSPIIPLIVGKADRAIALARRLEDHGLLGVAIRPPTVAPGSARVRLSLRADLQDDDLAHLIDVIRLESPNLQ